MIACLLIPGFELRAALRERPALALRPAALGPARGEEPVPGPVPAAAEAANVARSGQVLIVSDRQTRDFLAPLPLTLLPVDPERREELEELGVRRLGQLAGLPGAAVAERLGPNGRRAWSLARGEKRGKVRARKVANELAETLEFP